MSEPKINILLEVASLSMKTANRYVAPYSHAKSPQKYTQAQLVTCVVLRAYLKQSYRGIIEILETSDALRDRMGLKQLPHFSTLRKFADRSDVLHIVDCMVLDLARVCSGCRRSGHRFDRLGNHISQCSLSGSHRKTQEQVH